MGTPEIACPTLLELANDPQFQIVAVVTKPDQPIGRKQILTSPPVKVLAQKLNLAIYQPASLRKDEILKQTLKTFDADFLVVFAFGQILDRTSLNLAKIAPINLHASLLPAYRGASPIEQALLNGDQKTGISIMKMNEQMDQGGVYMMHQIPIAADDSAESLRTKISLLAAKHICRDLVEIYQGKISPQAQNHSAATYCQKINKADGLINPLEQGAQEIINRLRAFTPWPGIFLNLGGQTLRLHQLQIAAQEIPAGKFIITNNELLLGTKSGSLQISEIQQAGKKKLPTATFLLGNRALFN